MKTYLSPTGVNLVDEFGKFISKNKVTLPNHIERDGYFFRDVLQEDLEYEEYLLEKENKNDKC